MRGPYSAMVFTLHYPRGKNAFTGMVKVLPPHLLFRILVEKCRDSRHAFILQVGS